MRVRTTARLGVPTLIGATVAVYLLALALHARSVVDSLYSDADAAAALVIAQLAPGAPAGREIVLGDFNWAEALWLLRGTSWLPHHLAVWQALPFALWAVTVALVAGAVGLVADRRAALLTAALGVCVGFGGREVFWTLNFHGLVVLHTALLALAVAYAATRPAQLDRPPAVAAAVAVGLLTAPGLPDQLLLVVGLLPLVALGAVWSRRARSWRPLVLAGVVAAVAVAAGELLRHLAANAGIVRDARPLVFTPGEALLSHVGLLAGALGRFVAGPALGSEVDLFSAIALCGVVLAAAAAALVAWRAWLAGRPAAAAEPTPPAADELLLLFCGLIIAATAASWIVNGLVADVTASRYLGALWLGTAAGLGVLSRRPGLERAAEWAVAALCLVATVGVLHEIEPTKDSHFPTPRDAAAVRHFAEANGATTGFAGNWDAFPLTWHSRFALRLAPLVNCADAGDPERGCAPVQHRISSWYAPGSARRSMLVIDAGQPGNPAVDRRFGKPVAFTNYHNYAIYVFDHDISRDVRTVGTGR